MTPKARIWRTLEDVWQIWPPWVELLVGTGIVVVIIVGAHAYSWLAG